MKGIRGHQERGTDCFAGGGAVSDRDRRRAADRRQNSPLQQLGLIDPGQLRGQIRGELLDDYKREGHAFRASLRSTEARRNPLSPMEGRAPTGRSTPPIQRMRKHFSGQVRVPPHHWGNRTQTFPQQAAPQEFAKAVIDVDALSDTANQELLRNCQHSDVGRCSPP